MTNTQWRRVLLITLLASAVSAGALAASPLPSPAAEDPSQELVPGGMETDRDSDIVLPGSKGIMRPVMPGERISKDSQKKQDDRQKKPKTKKNKNGQEVVDTSISPENPMTVVADRMSYNKTTGEVAAMGKVDIRHMMDTYQTEYVYGNAIAQKYVVPGTVTWTNPTTSLKADRAEYDAAKSMGRFENLNGWDSGTYYFQGASGIYDRLNNKLVIQKGYFTTRHAVAKVPDYRIEADYIDIYPGDHYTAHNVKLKAKNTTLITMKTYSGSLKPDDGSVNIFTLIPRPMFDSDNGWGFKNGLVIPFGSSMNPKFYLDNRWYSKADYRPDVGLKYDTPIGTAKFHYAEEESSTNDDGGIWVKKRPSLEFNTKHFYLFGSRFYVGVDSEVGYWDEKQHDQHIKGTYKGYDAYVSGDPWKLGKFMDFSWRAGYAKDYYGFLKDNGEDHIRRRGYYSLGLSGGYGPLSAWIYYTDRDMKGETPYEYDTYSSEKPVDFGFRWQATRMDAFSLSWSIDTVDGHLDHRYWTYYRDMHSFYAWIRYDDIERETRFMIMPKDFRF